MQRVHAYSIEFMLSNDLAHAHVHIAYIALNTLECTRRTNTKCTIKTANTSFSTQNYETRFHF